MKPSQLAATLGYLIPTHENTLIVGSPGIGKTDIVQQACEKLNHNLLTFHPVVSDPVDFKGLPAFVNGEADFHPFGDLKAIITAEKPTVAFFDDLGQAPPLVQASIMQLLLARQINGHAVPDCVSFVAATNRKGDKAAVSGILEPVKGRFTILNLETDVDEWCNWAMRNKVSTEWIAFAKFRPQFLTEFKPMPDIENSPTPRNFFHAAKSCSIGMPDDLEYAVIEGRLGKGAAGEASHFLKVFRHLPSVESVLANPDKANVPTDPATLYAISAAVSMKADKTNMDPVVKYAKRLPEEFSVFLVASAIRRDNDLQHTKGFIDWSSKYAELLITP